MMRHFAFADLNGDFTYQPGEPAARINDPEINWFSDVQLQGRIDPETLQVQLLDLTGATVLEQELDFSIAASRRGTGVTKNFLRIVTWSDDDFSAESAKRGLWEPSWFKEEIGFGLYVLEEFDPTKKSILLVHGVLDSPRVFETIADGKSEGNDGVVTVKSQLAGSAQRNATAIYGIADSHKGVVSNPCTLALLTAILQDGTVRATVPEC